MGGSGSGRWRSYSKKDAVEDGLKLSIIQVTKGLNWINGGILDNPGYSGVYPGVLAWGRGTEITDRIGYRIEIRNGRPVVHLTYTTERWNGPKVEHDYELEVTSVPCHFGGLRWWWICPLVKNGRTCYRRAYKLYLPPGASYFGCRHCYDLTYRSCQESHALDAMYAQLARDTGMDKDQVKWGMKQIAERYRSRSQSK